MKQQSASTRKRIAVFAFEDIQPLQEIIRGMKHTVNKSVDAEVKTFFCHQEFTKLDAQTKAAVEQGFDIFFTIGLRITQKVSNFCKKSAPHIPVVFNGLSDPVDAGVVSSLNSPGCNVTGISPVACKDALEKDVDALLKICPYTRKILIPYDENNKTLRRYIANIPPFLRARGINLVCVPITNTLDLQIKMKALLDETFDVVLTLRDYSTIPAIPFLAELCRQTHSILLALDSNSVRNGAAASFAPSEYDIGCIAGTMIASITSGTKQASEIPVATIELDEVTKLVVNQKELLQQRKHIGEHPSPLLVRQDTTI
jgi:putative ABC transport system substrate-binding protein